MALADSEADARRLALETWPTAALGGELGQVLPLPAHFEAAVAHVTEDDVAESILCSQDPDAHIARLQEFERAGYDRVVVQQVGLDQDRLFEMYAGSVLPAFAGALTRVAAAGFAIDRKGTARAWQESSSSPPSRGRPERERRSRSAAMWPRSSGSPTSASPSPRRSWHGC
jgi:hypothetical protein